MIEKILNFLIKFTRYEREKEIFTKDKKIKVIVKKENYENWWSLSEIKEFNYKTTARIYEWYKEKQGYEVEEYEE